MQRRRAGHEVADDGQEALDLETGGKHKRRKKRRRNFVEKLFGVRFGRCTYLLAAVWLVLLWSGLVIWLYRKFVESPPTSSSGVIETIEDPQESDLTSIAKQVEENKNKLKIHEATTLRFIEQNGDTRREKKEEYDEEGEEEGEREEDNRVEANTDKVLEMQAGTSDGDMQRWDWLDQRIKAYLTLEEDSWDTKQEDGEEADESGTGHGKGEYKTLLSMLRLLKDQVNWVSVEGRNHKRPKEAVVIGTANIIKRDFSAISQAYTDMGVKVEKASHLSAAVARGRIDGNLRSVRNKDWGVILCMSLKSEKCLSDTDFGRLEAEKAMFSRINRIAGLQDVLWSKDRYCETAQRSGMWLAAFTFPCWVLPKDEDILLMKLRSLSKLSASSSSSSWIVKPYKQGGGKGIFVLDTVQEVQDMVHRNRKVVLQPYLANPHLLNKRKWDLRTYVLVTSVTPVSRAYLYNDGLVRLATEEYDHSAKHGGNKTQFLTNTSINKKKVADMSLLTWPFVRLEETLGARQFQNLFARIQRAIGMLLVTSEEAFRKRFEQIGTSFRCSNCYHLLGVDLIVDDTLMPRVIEVNGEPSMLLTGTSQSHYDTTKSAMQKEVAKVVLKPLAKVPARLVEAIRRAKLSEEEVQWIANDEQVMVYLLQLTREFSNILHFRPVYPDPLVCINFGRKQLWDAFVQHLYPGDVDDLHPRMKLHRLLDRLVCALLK